MFRSLKPNQPMPSRPVAKPVAKPAGKPAGKLAGQSRPKSMPYYEAGLLVFSATNKEGYPTYEDKDGGIFTDPLLKQLCSEKAATMSLQEGFNEVARKTREKAAKGGVEQEPVMKIYFNVSQEELKFKEAFQAPYVLFVAPDYDKDCPLPGGPNDAGDLVSYAPKIFKAGCQITILAKLPEEVHVQARALKSMGIDVFILYPTQMEIQKQIKEHMRKGSAVIFVSAHGAKSKKDEYIMVGLGDNLFSRRVHGTDIMSFFLNRDPSLPGRVTLVVDMCKCFGFPDDGDYYRAVAERFGEDPAPSEELVAARSFGDEPPPQRFEMDQEVVPLAVALLAHKVLNNNIGPFEFATYKFAEFVVSGECNLAPASGGPARVEMLDDDLEIAPPPNEEVVEEGPDGQETPDGQDPPVVPPGPNGLAGRGLVSDVGGFLLPALQWAGRAWDGLEGAGQMVFGAGLGAMLGLALTVAVMLSGVGALYLGLQHAARHEARRLSVTSIVMMAFLAGLPYLFDPVVLQKLLLNGVTPEGSVYLGLAGAAFSLLCTLVYILSDFRNLKQRATVLPRATHFLAKTSGLAGLLLQLHFMDGRGSVQQTVHVRANGVDSYVMYYPMVTNSTGKYCAVPTKYPWFALLPQESGYSMFDKEFVGGGRGDVTCLYEVFCKRVAERAGNDAGNIQALSFNYGMVEFQLTEVHQEVASIRRMFAVDNSTWAQDPVLSRVALAHRLDAAWRERGINLHLEGPTMNKPEPLTWIERVAAPFFVAVGALTGTPALPKRLSKNALWPEL